MKKTILFVLFAVLGFGTLVADAQGKKIGMKRAKEIAMKQATGKIKSSELEKENGKWIYSFDVRNAKGTITEVNIDAYTGAVIDVQEENAQKEADEKKQEKMEKKKN
jgi:Peptidase propeptide and YPEB domain